MSQHKQVSDDTARIIDEEVRRLIDSNYERTRKILTDNVAKLHKMAEALIKYETIDEHQIADIMAGGEARVPAGWEDAPPPAPPSAGAPTATPDVSNPASQH